MNFKTNKHALVFDEEKGTILTPVYKSGLKYTVYVNRNGARRPIEYNGELYDLNK